MYCIWNNCQIWVFLTNMFDVEKLTQIFANICSVELKICRLSDFAEHLWNLSKISWPFFSWSYLGLAIISNLSGIFQ